MPIAEDYRHEREAQAATWRPTIVRLDRWKQALSQRRGIDLRGGNNLEQILRKMQFQRYSPMLGFAKT